MWWRWCFRHQSCRHRQLASGLLHALARRTAWCIKLNRCAATGTASAPGYTAIKHRTGTRAWVSPRPFGIAAVALVAREVTMRRTIIGAELGGESALGFTVERPAIGMRAWVSRARGAIVGNNKKPGDAKAQAMAPLRCQSTNCRAGTDRIQARH